MWAGWRLTMSTILQMKNNITFSFYAQEWILKIKNGISLVTEQLSLLSLTKTK